MIARLVTLAWFAIDAVRLTLDRRSERQKRLDWAVLAAEDSSAYLD